MEDENVQTELCEAVRFALGTDEPLTDEQQKHCETCASCRAYAERTAQMKDDLAALVFPLPQKNGKGIADAVMDEIRVQNAFSAGKSGFAGRRFRHAGLVAAAVVVTCMAIPVVVQRLHAPREEALADSAAGITESITADEETELYAMPEEVSGTASAEMPEEEPTAPQEDRENKQKNRRMLMTAPRTENAPVAENKTEAGREANGTAFLYAASAGEMTDGMTCYDLKSENAEMIRALSTLPALAYPAAQEVFDGEVLYDSAVWEECADGGYVVFATSDENVFVRVHLIACGGGYTLGEAEIQ